MKILWISDCPDNRVHTGYATATRLIAIELIKRGHTFVFGSQGSQELNIQEVQVGTTPCKSYGFGLGKFLTAQAVGEINEHEKPDVIVTMADWQMVENMMGLTNTDAFSKWICYAPVDGNMLSTYWNYLIAFCPSLVYMSPKFGPSVCQPRRFGYVNYVPLPLDMSQHTLMPDQERAEFKAKCKVGSGWSADTKTVLTVARNQWRKNYPEIIKAAAILKERIPGVYSFVFHCKPVEPMGWDLPKLIDRYGVNDCVAISDQNLNVEQKNFLFNSADLFLLPSLGEGFGIPIIEAALYDIPVITTNDTAGKDLTEIIGCSSMNLDFTEQWQHGPTIPRPFVSAATIADKLCDIEMGDHKYDLLAARLAVKDNFNVRVVADKWEKILEASVTQRNRRMGLDLSLGGGQLAITQGGSKCTCY